jgi:hypothetical protein
MVETELTSFSVGFGLNHVAGVAAGAELMVPAAGLAPPSLTGANTARAEHIRRCYKCRRIGHEAEDCRTVDGFLSADKELRRLWTPGARPYSVVRGTMCGVPAHFLLDSGAGLNTVALDSPPAFRLVLSSSFQTTGSPILRTQPADLWATR